MFLVLDSCIGMALKSEIGQKEDNDTRADFKDSVELKFNKTVDKVVEAKMLTLDFLGRSFNKTVDVLVGATYQLKDVKNVAEQKILDAYNKTAEIIEDFKEDVSDYKQAKAASKSHKPHTKVVYVPSDFLDGIPTINGLPRAPLSTGEPSSKNFSDLPVNSYSSPSVYVF